MLMPTKIEALPIVSLRLCEDNPRTHSDEQIAALRASLREFGFVAPVLIDQARNVIAGHGRLAAAVAEGLTEAPCVCITHLSEVQRRAYMLADNRLAELARWDRALVSAQLVRLRDAGFDLRLTGFDQGDIILDTPQEPYEDDAFDQTPDEDDLLDSGSLWQLGNHRLMVGNATRRSDMARLMGSELADLLLTDPPYGVDYTGGTGKRLKLLNDNLRGPPLQQFLTDAFNAARDHMRPGAAYYCWHPDGDQALEFRLALRESGLQVRQCLIWVKNSAVISRQDYHWQHEPCMTGTVPTTGEDGDPWESCAYGWREGSHQWHGDRKQTTVLVYDRPTRNREHPTAKPVKLFARLVENSTIQGETVLDPFAGSGTTLIACEQLGRRACCLEKDRRYAAVILRRWEALTGRKAELITA